MTGDEVEQWRLAQGFTKSEAAEAIGVTRTTYRNIEKNGASKTQALAMEAVTMKRATIEDVEKSLASWGDAENHIDGFTSWTWDYREESLEKLEQGDHEQLVSDLAYNLDSYRELKELPSLENGEAACLTYIEEHKDRLIEELRASLED